jgi:regulatory protein
MIDRLKDALIKAASFCAYQERTQQEVRERLNEWDVYGDDADLVIVELIEQNYLNEERFAKTFAGSKFRVKSWGKHKIRQHLKQRGITGYNLDQAMKEIEPDSYQQRLAELLEKKKRSLTDSNPLVIKQKLARYAIGKGYEPDLVWKILGEAEH